MRLTLAVIIGYAIFAVSAVALFQLTQQAPHASASVGFMILATIYGMAFGAAGGWLAQRIAARDDAVARALVAGVIALGALISLVATWRVAAHWSQWTALLLMAPSAFAGGMIRRTPPNAVAGRG